MDESVRKYLQEKYSERIGDINTAQAFANLGDVIAGQKVGSQNPFYSEQRGLAGQQTLGEIERADAKALKEMQMRDALQNRLFQQAMAMQGLDLRKAQLAQGKELAGMRADEKAKKEAELSATQAKQLGLAQMGAKAAAQYEAAVKKGIESGEFDPTSYGDWLQSQGWAPQFIKSAPAKEAAAAQMNWVENYLRDASGAAIPMSERQSYAEIYFPRPGDTPEIVANKAELRKQKESTAMLGAGPGAKQIPAQIERKTYQGKTYELIGPDRNDPKSWKVIGE